MKRREDRETKKRRVEEGKKILEVGERRAGRKLKRNEKGENESAGNEWVRGNERGPGRA